MCRRARDNVSFLSLGRPERRFPGPLQSPPPPTQAPSARFAQWRALWPGLRAGVGRGPHGGGGARLRPRRMQGRAEIRGFLEAGAAAGVVVIEILQMRFGESEGLKVRGTGPLGLGLRKLAAAGCGMRGGRHGSDYSWGVT